MKRSMKWEGGIHGPLLMKFQGTRPTDSINCGAARRRSSHALRHPTGVLAASTPPGVGSCRPAIGRWWCRPRPVRRRRWRRSSGKRGPGGLSAVRVSRVTETTSTFGGRFARDTSVKLTSWHQRHRFRPTYPIDLTHFPLYEPTDVIRFTRFSVGARRKNTRHRQTKSNPEPIRTKIYTQTHLSQVVVSILRKFHLSLSKSDGRLSVGCVSIDRLWSTRCSTSNRSTVVSTSAERRPSQIFPCWYPVVGSLNPYRWSAIILIESFFFRIFV